MTQPIKYSSDKIMNVTDAIHKLLILILGKHMFGHNLTSF